MYGIILDSMTDCIKQLYGEDTWKRVVGSADISNTIFTTHKIYDEQLIQMIAKATGEITGNTINTVMEKVGKHFIVYIDDIRNDRIAKVLGRTFKDFINGLDCMHEYYRFSFPEIQPPSFCVVKEDANGIELHYRSRRTFTGFMYYVKGLMSEIATKFYSLDAKVSITQHGFTGDVMCAEFRLDFCNAEYSRFQNLVAAKRSFRERNNLQFPSDLFFELYPFHVVFDERLEILSTGYGLEELYTRLEGRRINETFFLTRPLGYDLTWENVIIHANNVFELTSVKATGRRGKTDDTSRFRHQMAATHFIKLRGQMLYVEQWNFVIFLATLVLDDLNIMYEMGIFVNDLTFHDLSRDMVLHGPQQTNEYKLALDLEQGKTARLEEMIETLDSERRKVDDLLYSMIPKEIAGSLRRGNTTVSLCERYDDVTVLFSDIVNFACIYMHIAPHEIMIILNMMVSVFDILCNKFDVYKVETVADGFMAVSGAPTYNEHHAANMADMAFEMLNGIKTVKDPNTRESIQIRIGLHCGYVIAGLVGHKIPRYCLFGETVNIASKMEATGEGQKIQISQTCKENLGHYGNKYIVEDKGTVNIKGCIKIMTYWLRGRNMTDKDKKDSDHESDKNEEKKTKKDDVEKESTVCEVTIGETKKDYTDSTKRTSGMKLEKIRSLAQACFSSEKINQEEDPLSKIPEIVVDCTVNCKDENDGENETKSSGERKLESIIEKVDVKEISNAEDEISLKESIHSTCESPSIASITEKKKNGSLKKVFVTPETMANTKKSPSQSASATEGEVEKEVKTETKSDDNSDKKGNSREEAYGNLMKVIHRFKEETVQKSSKYIVDNLSDKYFGRSTLGVEKSILTPEIRRASSVGHTPRQIAATSPKISHDRGIGNDNRHASGMYKYSSLNEFSNMNRPMLENTTEVNNALDGKNSIVQKTPYKTIPKKKNNKIVPADEIFKRVVPPSPMHWPRSGPNKRDHSLSTRPPQIVENIFSGDNLYGKTGRAEMCPFSTAISSERKANLVQREKKMEVARVTSKMCALM